MATSQPKAPARRRRWYQYSLRTMLLVMLLASIGMSWVAVRMERLRKQRAAIAAIGKFGGGVNYDYQRRGGNREPPGPAWLRNLFGDDFFATVAYASLQSDRGHEHLGTFTEVKRLDMFNSDLGDTQLRHVEELRQLEVLNIHHTRITDAGLEHLKGLTRLQELWLHNTKVTDAGMEHLRGMKHLQWLLLDKTRVTDAGLEPLEGMAELRMLSLGYTQITDAGLEHLKGLAQLQKLHLSGTRVTAEGVKKLQQALPKCEIYR